MSAAATRGVEKSASRWGRTVILGAPPLYCKGLSAALVEAGLEVEESSDVNVWVRGDGPRCVILVGTVDNQILFYTRLPSSPAVVVIETDPSTTAYADALRAGARTLLDRDSPVDLLVEAVRAALREWTLLPFAIAQELCSEIRSREGAGTFDIREIDWLKALAAGMTIARLAKRAGYSEREMYRRLHRLYCRLDAKSRTVALVKAARLGLVD